MCNEIIIIPFVTLTAKTFNHHPTFSSKPRSFIHDSRYNILNTVIVNTIIVYTFIVYTVIVNTIIVYTLLVYTIIVYTIIVYTVTVYTVIVYTVIVFTDIHSIYDNGNSVIINSILFHIIGMTTNHCISREM